MSHILPQTFTYIYISFAILISHVPNELTVKRLPFDLYKLYFTYSKKMTKDKINK